MKEYFYKLPKAELHVHIEGVLEPELLFKFSERNKIKIPYSNIEEVRQAYQFRNLQHFLDIYYQGQQVLRKEEDFYELILFYGKMASSQGVRHAEIFFETQTYHDNAIAPRVILEGLIEGIRDCQRQFDISIYLLLCFLRDLPESSAFKALQQCIPYQEHISGVGLASEE